MKTKSEIARELLILVERICNGENEVTDFALGHDLLNQLEDSCMSLGGLSLSGNTMGNTAGGSSGNSMGTSTGLGGGNGGGGGEYLPLIPKSPLGIMLGNDTDQLTRLNGQVRGQTDLQTTRRMTESIALLKDKVSSTSSLMASMGAKSILELDEKAIAVQLSIFDAEMFNLIGANDYMRLLELPLTVQQVFPPYSSQGGVPHSIRSVLDFSFYTSRIVMVTILTVNESMVRAKVISKWIDVALNCFQFKNHPSMVAILTALSDPLVSRLESSWHLVDSKHRQAFKDYCDMFERYDSLVSRMGSSMVPWIQPTLFSLFRIKGSANPQSAFMSLMGSLEVYKSGVSPSNYPSFAQKQSVASLGHWIVSQMWMFLDQLKNLSETCEPVRSQPGSVMHSRSGSAQPQPQSYPHSRSGSAQPQPQSYPHSRSGSTQATDGLIQQVTARIQSTNLETLQVLDESQERSSSVSQNQLPAYESQRVSSVDPLDDLLARFSQTRIQQPSNPPVPSNSSDPFDDVLKRMSLK